MKKIFLLFSVLFFTNAFAQKADLINPKGKWYLGAETGVNIINEYAVDQKDVSLQGGVLAEYYIGKQWSLSARLKYFKTGLAFYRPDTHSGSWLDLGSDESFGTFRGAVISMPVDIKWEFRLYKNLRANLKLGVAYNIETKSEYNYSENLSTDYAKQFASLNSGIGLNYFVDEKLAIYADYEYYLLGGYKGSTHFIILNGGYYPQNALLNFGVKYNFKK
ncbi:outer membrane beta-barrel protein [Kaistella jeonii]|uniref:outer membrane beta-barrel protein n=1 Tax=Kaistella jeonii TaxID=266749 RepID=UPI000691C15A|nr:outer membrane beta-barrel protein [Kaistella jeonii]SFB94663.1 Outer membrane protein beta-barrel domain-containing protein [Kaistella jeonii]VEI97106.1 Uncharacterised protein [Kaistella jeonii]